MAATVTTANSGAGNRERRIVGGGEWVERNGYELAIGEGETEKDDRAQNEDGDFQEANHTSLIRSTSSSPGNCANDPKAPQPSD